MPLSSCDEDRLQLAQRAEEQFDKGRELAEAGDHAGALNALLFAFDHSLAVSGWGGVRLSYIPGEIAELGVNYPPALDALRARRDARERLIRDGETDYNVVAEWTALNQYLLDKDRELILLNEMEAAGTLKSSLKKTIVQDNFERLLQEKAYKTLSDYFDNFGRSFLYVIFNYEECSLFPGRFQSLSDETFKDYMTAHIILEGAKVYELAIGIKKPEIADEIAKRVLTHCDPTATFMALIAAAEHVGSKKKVKELRSQAKAALSPEAYASLVP
jgi:hypothetical protein